jgi:hypothetical protein
MANRSLKAEAKSKDGNHLTVHSQDTDALILPVPQLQELHQFRPDLVDVVIQETRSEAEHRRLQESRINMFIFIEHMFGQIVAVILALAGMAGGIYAALQGQPWIGGLIVTATIGTLAVAVINKFKRKS